MKLLSSAKPKSSAANFYKLNWLSAVALEVRMGQGAEGRPSSLSPNRAGYKEM